MRTFMLTTKKITALIFLPLILIGCNQQAEPTKKLVRPIMWTEVSLSTLEQIRVLSGIVAPVEATKLSFEVNGKIEEIAVNLGDEVVKGQELAYLNKRSFNL